MMRCSEEDVMNRTLRIAAVAGSLVILTSPVRAAHELEPGLWQLTETGSENGMPAKPEVSSDCLSAEDARDPVKTILKDTEGQQCETRKVQNNGNTAVVELKCGDPKTTRMEIDMTINFESARHYSGTMKSLVIFRGQKLIAEKTMDAKWIAAACKK
jgi:hypothetical protein